jgi:DNA-directed RNA polymerase subunit K/omega
METLNKYETARIIGARALQISLGAPVLLDVPKSMMDPLKIARFELSKDAIPIAVKRE